MTLLLLLSITIRLVALGWSAVLLVRLRDLRMAFLTGMLALMTLRQVLTLRQAEASLSLAIPGDLSELPGLVVSALALVAVVALERMLGDSRSAESRLRASRNQLQMVMDTIPQRLFWKDRKSRYLGCNRHFARDAGLTDPSEIVGKTDFDLDWRASAGLYRQDDRTVMESGEPMVDYEEPQVLPDGKRLWLRTTKVPLRDSRGEVVGIFGSYQDVTEAKDAEEALRESEAQLHQAQKMEVLGRLAGGVAHDFNNLLTAITGNVELLLEGASEGDREELDQIARAAERAAWLTRQLLVFSRHQPSAPRSVRVEPILTALEPMVRRVIGEDIDLRFDVAPELPPVRVDPVQLEQAILNLVINSRDAMPSGGGLTVSARESLPPGDGDPAPHVRVTVTDTGCGMDEATRERALEPFFTTKEPGRGTGLGLSTVYGVVTRANGWLNVESEPGRGARFDLWFPAAGEVATQAAEAGPEPEGKTAGAGETVLLTEDSDPVRTLTGRLLTEAGYLVLSAADPEHALELAEDRHRPIDLFLLDMILPTMGGPQLAERLLACRPGTAVLYMSGYSEDATDPGTASIVAKPFHRDELLARVRTAIDARKGDRAAGRGEGPARADGPPRAGEGPAGP